MATKTPAGGPFYLLITEERTRGFGFEKEYFHLYARVVRDRYENGDRYPYGLDDTYGNGPLLSGLRATCQGDTSSQQHEHLGDAVYGIGLEYHDAYSSRLELRQLRRMTKTFEAVERKLAKLQETRGHYRTYGEYLGRLAEVTGCSGMALLTTEKTYQQSGVRYQWLSLGDGVNAANNRIWSWQRELKAREQEAAS